MNDSEISFSSDDMVSEDGSQFIGLILNNKYLTIKKLGRGLFADVLLSYCFADKHFYAIKMHQDDSYEYGMDEVRTLRQIKQLKSPYMMDYVEHFEWENENNDDTEENSLHLCVVYELLAGNIYNILKLDKYRNGMPVETVKEITRQLLIGLDLLHRKTRMIHTDVKPENILFHGVNANVFKTIKKFKEFEFEKKLVEEKKKYQKNMKKNKKRTKGDGFIQDVIDRLITKLDTDDEDREEIISGISNECINNIQTKLADFGTAILINDNPGEEIQSRHYRAPEVVLACGYNEKCDIWSVGCLVYELLTGKLLFDPSKTSHISRDKFHIINMYEFLGKIPDNLIKSSTKRDIFFRSNGMIRSVPKIHYKPIKMLLKKNLKQNISDDELNKLFSFVKQTLEYEPKKRLSASNCLSHPWLK